MEESEPSPSSDKEVLIIPLHQNATPPSPAHQTSSPSSHQTKPTPTAPSPRGSGSPGSQLFAELLECHARRSPRTASPEPVATPPREATPSPTTTPSPVTTPRSPPLSPNSTAPTTPGGLGLSSPKLLQELKQPHPLKHVAAHKGLTTVFSGRGRTPSSSSPTSEGGDKPQRLSNGMQH